MYNSCARVCVVWCVCGGGVYRCMCTCVRLQGSEVNIKNHFSGAILLVFWDRVSYCGLQWSSQPTHRLPCTCLPSTRISSAHHHACLAFYVSPEDQAQACMLSQRALYHRGQFPSPQMQSSWKQCEIKANKGHNVALPMKTWNLQTLHASGVVETISRFS